MTKILQAEGNVGIEDTGDNTFVFEFQSSRYRSRALKESPWNFFRNLLIFKEPIGLKSLRLMDFEETTIWVQFHNIPLAFMHEDILLKLGRQIGMVVDLYRGENGLLQGRFARIRVRINITQPLKKCIRICAMRDEDDTIVLLVYGILPDFCYACGRLDHVYRDCEDD
ncbi:uncharacterized protein At4g02000-like [Henckelia pumila]|uniref:uncharacterized protein At4g02000-like n=1 Tax=Henckelia pumila TaxID=405737 RepID=UPI003C6E1B55